MRSEVFIAVKIQVEALWVVIPCSVAVGYQHFGGPCCLRFQGEVIGDGKRGHCIGLECKRVARVH